MKPVFPEPEVPRVEALGVGEPAVNFLVQSTWKVAIEARSVINGWARHFPARSQIEQRLKASNDIDHYGAIDELFIHSLLANMNSDIRYEEFGRGPDFRLYGNDSLVAAVEVASLFMKEEWQREWRNYGYVADALNERLAPRGLYLQVEPQVLSTYPSKKQLVGFANQYIDAVEALVPYSQGDLDGPIEIPSQCFEGEGFAIRFQLLPFRSSRAPEEQGSVAAVGPAIGGIINSSERLRGVLRAKLPGRYELEEVPYAIAVCNHDMFCSVETVSIALYGSERVVFSTDGEDARPFRAADGFFGKDQKHPEGRNRRVSGVVFISELASWAPDEAKSYFLPNPYAAFEWPRQIIPVRHRLECADQSSDSWTWNPALGEQTFEMD